MFGAIKRSTFAMICSTAILSSALSAESFSEVDSVEPFSEVSFEEEVKSSLPDVKRIKFSPEKVTECVDLEYAPKKLIVSMREGNILQVCRDKRFTVFMSSGSFLDANFNYHRDFTGNQVTIAITPGRSPNRLGEDVVFQMDDTGERKYMWIENLNAIERKKELEEKKARMSELAESLKDKSKEETEDWAFRKLMDSFKP